MNKFNINDFVRGWFIGDFDHSLHKTTGFEVAVKFYNKGELHPQHVHKIGTEYTVVTTGKFTKSFFKIERSNSNEQPATDKG